MRYHDLLLLPNSSAPLDSTLSLYAIFYSTSFDSIFFFIDTLKFLCFKLVSVAGLCT